VQLGLHQLQRRPDPCLKVACWSCRDWPHKGSSPPNEASLLHVLLQRPERGAPVIGPRGAADPYLGNR
jgi:hypothetical protein